MLASLTNNLHESNNQSYRVLQSKPTSMTCNCHEYCLRCSRAVQVLLVSHTSVSQMYQRCRAEPLGIIGGAWSGAFVFCVEKGRLFERSEFLPFSKKWRQSSPGGSALDFFFWYLFFCIKAKEKYIHYLRSNRTSSTYRIHKKVFSHRSFRLLRTVATVLHGVIVTLEIYVKLFLCLFVRYVHRCVA